MEVLRSGYSILVGNLTGKNCFGKLSLDGKIKFVLVKEDVRVSTVLKWVGGKVL
jgi:hypothetical protein